MKQETNLMWAASWAINDMLKLGHMTQWSVHPMEHPLSAFIPLHTAKVWLF